MVPPAADDESGAMDNASPTPTGTTGPPPPPPPPSGPRVSRDQMKDLGRLRRSVTDRRVAGVAGGIARHFDVDPIIVRVALVVAAFFGGAGLLGYIALWILVPEEGTDDHPLGLDRRSRSLALAGVGVLALLIAVGDWAGASWFPWPVAIVAAIAVVVLHRKERSTGRDRGYGYEPGSGYQPETGYASVGAYEQQTYATTYPTEPHEYARTPRQRHPRRRGPILFFFTLALIVLAEGVLGVVDLAGTSVSDSAYPALALGIVAAMLVLGSFWGRAGGLIALGVVAALATAGATLATAFPEQRIDHAPTSAGQVRDAYDFGGGRFTLDLSDVADVDALDGREISIDGVGGRIEVIVPDGVAVDVQTEVVGGDSRVFDQRQDGFDVQLDRLHGASPGAPTLSLTIDLLAGEIIVRDAA